MKLAINSGCVEVVIVRSTATAYYRRRYQIILGYKSLGKAAPAVLLLKTKTAGAA